MKFESSSCLFYNIKKKKIKKKFKKSIDEKVKKKEEKKIRRLKVGRKEESVLFESLSSSKSRALRLAAIAAVFLEISPSITSSSSLSSSLPPLLYYSFNYNYSKKTISYQ